MTAYIHTLADAVATLITDAAGDLPIASAVAAKRFLPFYDLEELGTPKIAVAPRLETRSLASRSKTNRELFIQIAPHLSAKTIADGQYDEAKIGEFIDLMDAIANVIELTATEAAIAKTTLSRIETTPLYDDALLQEKGVLRGVLTLTFRAAFAPLAA